ncbi:MAG: TetR/AcrR family transcriptional regulator [Candidatus Nanopelagicales bacterium]
MTITAAPREPGARGRGLDVARTQEIYRSAVALLAEVGYDRLTMDAVAARAKASKATLYRRWPGKAELITEAIYALQGESDELPDTGDLRGDLLAFFAHVGEDKGQSQVCMIRGLVSACSSDEALAVAFRQQLVNAKRERLLRILQRARDRGTIAASCDIDFLVDVLPAALMYRFLVTNQPVDQGFIRRLIDDIALPLLIPPTICTNHQ